MVESSRRGSVLGFPVSSPGHTALLDSMEHSGFSISNLPGSGSIVLKPVCPSSDTGLGREMMDDIPCKGIEGCT